jgi:hypothetical protein
MEEQFYPQADVTYGKGGIVVNATEISMYSKHYNVKITKVDDMYYVSAERPGYDCFLDNEFDPEIVNTVIDSHVETTSGFLGLGGTRRYVHGWCELKRREHLNISSNNITIVTK